MDVHTFWPGLYSCYAFYIEPYCSRNHNAEFDFGRTTLILEKLTRPKKLLYTLDVKF